MNYKIMDEYREYRIAVSVFCYYVANLARFVKIKKNSDEIDKKTFQHFIKCTAEYRKKVLQLKEELDLPGGLSFLEDNKFNGFSIEKGEISGDFHFADAITIPWLSGFPDSSNCYQFEVACYIQMLIHPDCLDNEIDFAFEPFKEMSEESEEIITKSLGNSRFMFSNWLKKEIVRCKKILNLKSSVLVQAVQEAIF